MNTLLSICIPTYNSKKLSECIDAVIVQAKRYDIPIYIQDNNVENVFDVRKYEYRYLFYEQNVKNVGADRNMFEVLKRANTEYALWLGDDDIVEEGAIKIILNILTNKPDLVICEEYGFEKRIAKKYHYNNPIEFYCSYEPNPIYFGNIIVKTQYLQLFDFGRYVDGCKFHIYNAYINEYLYRIYENKEKVDVLINMDTLICRGKKGKTWKKDYFSIMLFDVFKYYCNQYEPYKVYRWKMILRRMLYYVRKVCGAKCNN